MTRYKCMKPLDQLQIEAAKAGWEVDLSEFNTGSDWFMLKDLKIRMLIVAVNCFGRFLVYTPTSSEPIATECSEGLDTEYWYCELLDLLNVPLD